MPAKKELFKDDILRAIRHTKSNRAAARYLGCSYQHYKPYAKLFNDEETGQNLFDLHKNQCGKGIPKFLPNRRREPNVKLIFEEGVGYESFTTAKIKTRGIAEGFLRDECYICGCNERRVTDYKTPTLLNFKDGSKSNYVLDNLEILCYNCYFLYVADPLTNDEVRHIETNQTPKAKPFEWDLDDEALSNMKALGLI
jgi:hypothetical protein